MPEPQSLTATAENGEQIKSTQENRGMENMNLTDFTLMTTTTPRSVIIVPRSKSQAASGRVTPAPVADASSAGCLLEKRLPNGDLYIGTFCGSTPHGSGKYLWRDGCMYEGEWKKGKASGRGRFSWPSGATFEGDFRSGRMEGSGTFIGPDGDMYKGSWSGDRKHGYGVKHCSNGDYYEGNWKKNLQDGHGRYLWSNGNEYVGEWKNGTTHGRGILIWKNGNRYDGNWDSGLPKGHGVFTWADGSCYVGCWTTGNKGLQILNGTFYPSHNPKNENVNRSLKGYFNHKIWTPLTVMGEEHTTTAMISGDCNKNSPLADDAITERPFPRICIWESDGEAGDITCDIIDNSGASMLYRDGFDLNRDGLKHFMRNPCCFNGGEIKKPGHMVSKGHKNYSLMLNLQLGIRYTVGKHSSVSRDLKETDFNAMEKFWTRFPAEGSKTTPPHKSPEFRWKDYCPVVFRHLRELFQVDPTDYIEAICGNDALRELSSPGKSGSFFYLTQDDRFMIKTVKKSEVKVLVKMLPSYYRHVSRYENSLVTKFFGVHCVKPVCGVKTRFIVMGNLFCSEYRIHRRFDLKGSSHGRMTDTSKGEIDETTTLKDLDLNYTFRLHTSWYQELIKQIHRDCEFLESEHIMDYSFLVGLHFRDEHEGDAIGLSPFTPRLGDSYQNEAGLRDMDRILAGGKPLIRLGANMPARAQHVDRRGDFDLHTRSCFSPSTPSPSGEIYDTVLYFGIIDILQGYDITKKLEHAYKSLHVDSTLISAVDPKLYSRRFRNFVGRIFIEDDE